MKVRSIYWNYFTELIAGKRMKCNYCSRSISITGGSVGNLGRHMKKKHPELYAPSLKRDANATDVQVHQAGNDMHELDEFIVIDVKSEESREKGAQKQPPDYFKKIRFDEKSDIYQEVGCEENKKCHSCCKKKLTLKERYFEKKLELMQRTLELLERNTELKQKNLEAKERIATALETLCS